MTELDYQQPPGRHPRGRTWVALLLALIASVVAWILRGRLEASAIPPGPRLERLKVEGDGTVIVRVLPDHRDRIQGAKFLPVPADPPGLRPSHVVFAVPAGQKPVPGFPRDALLTPDHLGRLTTEIGLPKPGEVYLDFRFDPKATDTLYAFLVEALKQNPKVEFHVTSYCWYSFGGSTRLSVEDDDLALED